MKKNLLIALLILLLSPSLVAAADRVEINTATLAQLDELTGIGPKYAQAIIDARPFSSIDDLVKVKGIGPKTLQKIKDQGLAYVDGQVSQSTPLIIEAPVAPIIAAPVQPEIVPLVYPAGVFLNEIMPNPKGPDETDEWIELYNSSGTDIDLSGWQIQDTAGTITTYTIPQNNKISAKGFLIFKRPDTQIMLNNDKDGLNLLTPDKKIIDSLTFTSAPLDQSYNKTGAEWQWSLTPTPEAKNIVTAAKVAVVAIKTLSNAKNSVKNDGVANGLADLSQNINTNQIKNPWFLFFIVLGTTIILATIILLIKLKLKTNVRT